MSYEPESSPASGRRERSSIAFPYGDLDSAVNVARTIYTRAGGQCSLDQLAAWLDYKSVDSGAFRLQVSTARIFGLLATARKALELTDLGTRIADTGRERQARVEAFLTVPLYRRTFDEFRGQSLPPDAGLESAFARMGVAAKQTDKARQAFQRSALQARFFDAGKDRLVEPSMPAPEKPHGLVVRPVLGRCPPRLLLKRLRSNPKRPSIPSSKGSLRRCPSRALLGATRSGRSG